MREKGITAKNIKLVREHKLKVYQHVFPICVNTIRKYPDPKSSKNPRSFASLVDRVLEKLCDIASAPKPILMAALVLSVASSKEIPSRYLGKNKRPTSSLDYYWVKYTDGFTEVLSYEDAYSVLFDPAPVDVTE